MKIDYHFYGQGWKYLNVNPNPTVGQYPLLPISGQPKAFGIWVYGDNHDLTIAMRFEDSTHQMFQIYPESGNTIYWNGWRYIQFYLYNFGTGHGGGADDGIVHFPIQYHTIFLLDNQIQANISSAVYISSPVIMY